MAATESKAGKAWRDIAASAYRAYAASTGNKNYQGLPMPTWDALPQPIRTAWEAAVRHASDVMAGNALPESDWEGWQPPHLGD